MFFRLIHQKLNTFAISRHNLCNHISQTLYTIDFQINQIYEKKVMAKQDIEMSTELL